MRVLQFPIPMSMITGPMASTIPQVLAHMAVLAAAMPPLIDDGAGSGWRKSAPTTSPFAITTITGTTGLLLMAKDASTLKRGLSAYPGNQIIASDDGGLALVGARWNDRDPSRVAGFLRWGYNNIKQTFIHDTFNMAAWIVKHKVRFDQRAAAHKSLNRTFLKMGGDRLFTFRDFCEANSRDNRLADKCAILLLCRTGDLAPDVEVPNGRVLRYISNSLSVRGLASHAEKAFDVKEREHASAGMFS
jgi:hypothetical protein